MDGRDEWIRAGIISWLINEPIEDSSGLTHYSDSLVVESTEKERSRLEVKESRINQWNQEEGVNLRSQTPPVSTIAFNVTFPLVVFIHGLLCETRHDHAQKLRLLARINTTRVGVYLSIILIGFYYIDDGGQEEE